MRGLEAEANQILDRRLAPSGRRPIAVAFSGGGDSLALTLMADRWARAHERELVVLTVDHALQPQSGAWTDACRATAAHLDRPFRALVWDGPKPTSGLPAAARTARHRLLAEAAREAGAEVILMGHTADDLAEARAMRAAGSTTPDAREWGPSPAWPEGRGLFLLRPLLGAGRAAIRGWLAERGETWIDDPANEDLRYARSRARRAGTGCVGAPVQGAPLAGAAADAVGVITLNRSSEPQLLRIACVCAGGGDRLPSGERVRRLSERLRDGERFTATMAGARVEAGDTVRISREPGEFARAGLGPLPLPREAPVVWDGRFEIVAQRDGLTVLPFGRSALPGIVEMDGAVACPLVGAVPGVAIRALVGERLAAASGLVDRESP